jgi:hypothetical protein
LGLGIADCGSSPGFLDSQKPDCARQSH